MKRLLLVLLLSAATSPSRDELPAYTVENGAIHIAGVGPDNPILYDNDWGFDVFDNNYLLAQASLGHANLRGNIISRDMWDGEKGYHYTFYQAWRCRCRKSPNPSRPRFAWRSRAGAT